MVTHVESGSYRKTYSRPEARREGYNMYYKKHPEQSARRSSRPIEDPVARKSTEQRSTGTAPTGQRRTSGESRSRNQGSGNVQTNTNTRTRTNGTSTQTVQPNSRTTVNRKRYSQIPIRPTLGKLFSQIQTHQVNPGTSLKNQKAPNA